MKCRQRPRSPSWSIGCAVSDSLLYPIPATTDDSKIDDPLGHAPHSPPAHRCAAGDDGVQRPDGVQRAELHDRLPLRQQLYLLLEDVPQVTPRGASHVALIQCPECGRQVSDRAAACPQCAHPLAATSPTVAPRVFSVADEKSVRTIEQTGKRYKKFMLVGILLAFGGCATLVSGGKAGDQSASTIGILLLIAGFITFVGARFGAWWHHG
jgi:hypothetical protein